MKPKMIEKLVVVIEDANVRVIPLVMDDASFDRICASLKRDEVHLNYAAIPVWLQ